MIDILAYPHLLQAISRASDRPTLCILLRTSSLAKELVLPILYPPHLIDPITSKYFSGGDRKRCECDPTLPLHFDTLHFDQINFQSLLSSPHLELARDITITQPCFWDEYLGSPGGRHLIPAKRGEGTTTTIHVGLGRSWWSAAPSEAERADALRGVKQGRGREGLRGGQGDKAKRAGVALDMPAKPYIPIRYTMPVPPPYHDVFDIASLLPSTHLIIYVNPSGGVLLPDLISELVDGFAPVNSPRTLTILIEDGNAFTLRPERLSARYRSRAAPMPWQSLELVLIPNSLGVFPTLPCGYDPPESSDAALSSFTPQLASADAEYQRQSRLGLVNLFPIHRLFIGPLSRMVIVGLEGTEISENLKELLPKGLARIRDGGEFRIGKGGDVESRKFATWQKGTTAATVDWI